jgi:ankyrin repeat protein
LEAPQDVLERLLSTRGYGVGMTIRVKAEDTCYDFRPSPLQLASFGTELVKAIHNSEVEKLDELLGTGLSPNPCNQFRDSIVDLVCKRANAPIFGCLVTHGCDLRVCDGFGRTPLHHCCWASEFSPEIAEIILKTDRQQLFMEDKRGQTPLEYVRPDQAPDWIEFLEERADQFFPDGGTLPPFVSLKTSRKDGQLPDPPKRLPVQLAGAVSSGTISPKELEKMDAEMRAKFS